MTEKISVRVRGRSNVNTGVIKMSQCFVLTIFSENKFQISRYHDIPNTREDLRVRR